MKSKSFIITAAVAAAISPNARAVLGVGDIVSDPIVEEAVQQKNIFDQLKYAWEQTQWAEKLATLHNTLSTVRDQLQTLNTVKQAIGDPAAAASLIDSGLFSQYFQESGIGDTLGELAGIVQEGSQLSATVQALFEPIDLSRWQNVSVMFDGAASFRDASDPLKRFRAVENAYAKFETIMGVAQNKRKVLNQQIAKLNEQLKSAKDDAEVQKVVGSLTTAQTALNDLDAVSQQAGQEVQLLEVLNRNRQQEEAVAAEDISRQRNRQLAQAAIDADNEVDLPQGDFASADPDLNIPNPNLPPGF